MAVESRELAVVVPVYNEEAVIARVLDKWTAELERLGMDYLIYVYNDGSRDGTLDVLQRYAAGNARVVVCDKPNSGHGPTVLGGYRANTDKEWIFQIDSDDELGPEGFEDLWRHRADYDLLIGKRLGRVGPTTRRFVSLVSWLTVRLLYGSGVYDVNCPYRLMRSKAFKEYFDAIPPDTFAPNVIITGIACAKKLRIYETLVDYSERRTGEVSIKKFKLFKAALRSFFQTVGASFRI